MHRSYGSTAPPPYSALDPQRPLLGAQSSEGRTVKRKDLILGSTWFHVVALLAAISFAGFVVQTCRAVDMGRRLADMPPTREERELLRRQWESERLVHQREHTEWTWERRDYQEEAARMQTKRKEWAEEEMDHRRAQEKWEHERREWDAEREARRGERIAWENEFERERREWKAQFEREREEWEIDWEREKRRRDQERMRDDVRYKVDQGRRFGLSWEQPEGQQCLSFGTREYTARMGFHWNEACEEIPLILGNEFGTPHKCDDEGVGRWEQLDDTTCKPYWGDLYDKGCMGQNSGKHRYEARLWDLRSGDDWMVMCSTTPANIHGRRYDSPTHCEHRGVFYGMVGMWDISDPYC